MKILPPTDKNELEVKKDNLHEVKKNRGLKGFTSFTYQSRSISFNGRETKISGRNFSMKNGEIKDESFEGHVDGNYFGSEIMEMQKKIMNSFFKLINPASWFLPKDKD